MMQKTVRMEIDGMVLLLCRRQVRNTEAEVQKKPASRRDVIVPIIIRAAIVGERWPAVNGKKSKRTNVLISVKSFSSTGRLIRLRW